MPLVSVVSVMESVGYMWIAIQSLNKKTNLFNLSFFIILSLARSLFIGKADPKPP